MQRRNFMLKSTAALALGGLALAGCTTTSNSGAQKTAGDSDERRSIDADVDATIQRLYATVRGSRELVGKSRGVLVFPSVIPAGFVVGAQYGKGALRVGGGTVGYYSTTSASVGLQAGAQSKSIIFLFMTQDALDKFRSSDGWSAGARRVGRTREDGRERQDRHNHRHGAGRSVHPDQRRPDGRCVAGRHQGLAPEDLTI